MSKLQDGAVDIEIPALAASSKYSTRQVFSSEEERLLEEYLINCSRMHYGLTYKQFRDFAYSYALVLRKTLPEGWNHAETAGIDWMKGFMKRHPQLSLRKPENTSLARNISFNRKNVETFYNNLETLMEKYKFPDNRILNLDESGVTTVLQSPKVIAPAGAKQVGQCVSAERGELVTFCGIVTASGSALPPVYVYPRVHFKDLFLYGAPRGSKGFANRSGWMTQEVFLEVLKHILVQTSSSKENPLLIVLDNHESHISLDAIIFCRENGIVLLTFPPHTSHRLQPLDVAVFGPFKSHCRSVFNKWISENPGKQIAIHNIAHLTASAFDEAFSRKNIIASFKKTGITPFNRSTFKEEDFLGSLPTDQPLVETPQQENTSEKTVGAETMAGCSTENNEEINLQKTHDNGGSVTPARNSEKKDFPTPEDIRPYPRAERRGDSKGKGRKKGKCCILTDTPEKNRIEAELLKRKICCPIN
ncbi:uncharacterized protein LOC120349672 [Nilaparvata lugens]|uniref:uncharacterized protein LOC120349672 n=1 Tax=Nilaparvata lugens TaxID=108931 RepID=UPI00193D1027|nr:uncharacterized protein LOC120349672 [Nilaparvata lugens]